MLHFDVDFAFSFDVYCIDAFTAIILNKYE